MFYTQSGVHIFYLVGVRVLYPVRSLLSAVCSPWSTVCSLCFILTGRNIRPWGDAQVSNFTMLISSDLICIIWQHHKIYLSKIASRSIVSTDIRPVLLIYWRKKIFSTALYITHNHNYNKILKSDCLSTALISAWIGQYEPSRTCLNGLFYCLPKNLGISCVLI